MTRTECLDKGTFHKTESELPVALDMLYLEYSHIFLEFFPSRLRNIQSLVPRLPPFTGCFPFPLDMAMIQDQ